MTDEKENKEQWYSKKDIFEMVQGLKDELGQTREIIRQYNNIREDLDWCIKEIRGIASQGKGQADFVNELKFWSGWIAAIIAITLKLLWG